MIQKLNIGSGAFKKHGYINVDLNPLFEPEVVHDLNIRPYPFPDNHFDLIEADHILAHLEWPLHVIRELHRIARPGATIVIRVPHFSRGFSHPEHKAGFDVSFPYFFDASFAARYINDAVMECMSMKFHWFGQPYVKKLALSPVEYYLGYFGAKVIDFFANLSPMFTSRVWCFWVGGFDGIECVFKVVK